jgi:serine/threonine-protein kinase
MADSKPLVATSPASLPAPAERFEDVREIARGGMSSIREVYDHSLLRSVALKKIDEELGDNKRELQRFVEEAQITGQLEHPNIVPIHNIGGDEENAHFFSMKLVEGETLTDILYSRKYYKRTEDQLYRVLQILLKVCDAVSFAHSRGVIHRDIKPDNIMVGRFGQVYLMDWGIAFLKSEQTEEPALDSVRLRRGPMSFDDTDDRGQIIGTYLYMAPEQARGAIDEIDERTDVFALGGVLYEMLTLQPPYDGNDVMTVVFQAQDGEIKPPKEVVGNLPLPQRLCDIAMKALSHERDERYASVEAFKEQIELFLNGAWRFPVRTFEAGTLIVEEGAHGDEAFIIMEGYCQAYKKGDAKPVVLRQMGPGDVFGETAIFSNHHRTASVVALSELKVRVVTQGYLNEQLGLASWLGYFVGALAERFCDLDTRHLIAQKSNQAHAIVNRILVYMNFYGAAISTTSRELEWSSLAMRLSEEFNYPVEDLEEVVHRSNNLSLDSERNSVILEL